jgi:hypothetical protein
MKKHCTYRIHKNKSMKRLGKPRTFKNEGKFVYIRKTGHKHGKYNRGSRKLRGGGGGPSRPVRDFDLTPDEVRGFEESYRMRKKEEESRENHERTKRNFEFLERIRKKVEEEKDQGDWPMKTNLGNLTEVERTKKSKAIHEILEELRQEEMLKLEEQAIEASLKLDKRTKSQDPSSAKRSKSSK